MKLLVLMCVVGLTSVHGAEYEISASGTVTGTSPAYILPESQENVLAKQISAHANHACKAKLTVSTESNGDLESVSAKVGYESSSQYKRLYQIDPVANRGKMREVVTGVDPRLISLNETTIINSDISVVLTLFPNNKFKFEVQCTPSSDFNIVWEYQRDTSAKLTLPATDKFDIAPCF